MSVTTRPELLGDRGMVASTHWLASAAGMAALEGGGNAADAAVTAGFVLQVVEPHLNGPGGEVPVIVARPGEAPVVVCGQGVAPRAATLERFAALGLDAVPGAGLLAACVPGAFDAWMLLLRDWGTLSVARVLEPAITLAEHGFPVLPRVQAAVAAVATMFAEHWPGSAAVWLRDGGPLAQQRYRLPALARTYTRLAAIAGEQGDRVAGIEAARAAWSSGFVAHAVDAFTLTEHMDATGVPHAGLLTGDDMARWQATVEAPVTLDVGGDTVCKPGPWSQGPVLLQQLALLDALGLAGMEPLGERWVHTVVEAGKLAFADREAWYGDPDHSDVPLHGLLSAAYARERAALVTDAASLELRPGAPDGRPPRLPRAAGASEATPPGASTGEPTFGHRGALRGDTCHLDVVDAQGLMISATPSGGWLTSSPCIPELGFCLGTRLQMFRLEPGLPSTLQPGARPRTTLSPTLVLRDGSPRLALGTPGGDQQDQWPLTVLLLHRAGRGLQEAIDAPRFHSTHAPSSFHPRQAHPGELVVEDRLGEAVISALRGRGHRVVVDGPWSLGRVCAVSRDADGLLHGAADARGMQAYAAGR